MPLQLALSTPITRLACDNLWQPVEVQQLCPRKGFLFVDSLIIHRRCGAVERGRRERLIKPIEACRRLVMPGI